MAANSLDDMLADPAPTMAPGGDDEEGSPHEEADEDEFSMHAEDFLDDSKPMPERIEALRNAILAASTGPGDDSGSDI